jgi:hypothetical protein
MEAGNGQNTCPKFTGIPEDFAERVTLVYEGGTRNVKKKQGVGETRVTCDAGMATRLIFLLQDGSGTFR